MYERKWFAAVIPFMLFLADIGECYYSKSGLSSWDSHDVALAVWYTRSILQVDRSWLGGIPLIQVNFFYAVTLALNLLCTSKYAEHKRVNSCLRTSSLAMISWKILVVHRKLPGAAVAGIRIQGIVAIIVESGELSSHDVSTRS